MSRILKSTTSRIGSITSGVTSNVKSLTSEAMGNFSMSFFGFGAAITASGLIIHMLDHYGALTNDNQLQCNTGSDNNCRLGGPYGDGILAVSIVAVVFCGLILIMLTVRAGQFLRMKPKMKELGYTRVTRGFMMVATAFAVAVSGYNLYVQQNFGHNLATGGFGEDCSLTAVCDQLGGSTNAYLLGLNATNIALAGIAILGHGRLTWLRMGAR